MQVWVAFPHSSPRGSITPSWSRVHAENSGSDWNKYPAYPLMTHHTHRVVETLEENVSRGVGQGHGVRAQRCNLPLCTGYINLINPACSK